jgi:hypothetical protein
VLLLVLVLERNFLFAPIPPPLSSLREVTPEVPPEYVRVARVLDVVVGQGTFALARFITVLLMALAELRALQAVATGKPPGDALEATAVRLAAAFAAVIMVGLLGALEQRLRPIRQATDQAE